LPGGFGVPHSVVSPSQLDDGKALRLERHEQYIVRRYNINAESNFSQHISHHDIKAHVYAAQQLNFSAVFAGQATGIKEVHEDIWIMIWVL